MPVPQVGSPAPDLHNEPGAPRDPGPHRPSMTRLDRTTASWKLRTRSLELGRRTLVMGLVNITPDSFSDGGSFLAPEAAIARALDLLEQGADLVDLGAESTRPGSGAGDLTNAKVSAQEEQQRLLPVLEGILKAAPRAVLSADTYKASTARAALGAGVEIINDVSGLTWDEGMAEVCAGSGCGVVLTHTRGRPHEWRGLARLEADALIASIRDGLSLRLAIAQDAGIGPASIVLDPGYGFGKNFDENYVVLARQAELLSLARPLLAALSRKSFLGHTLSSLHGGRPAPVEARESATIAALTAAILHGASIVRAHDVRAAVEAARIADAILEAD